MLTRSCSTEPRSMIACLLGACVDCQELQHTDGQLPCQLPYVGSLPNLWFVASKRRVCAALANLLAPYLPAVSLLQAVTCDDFLAAMADANGEDLSGIGKWYSQAGTPTLTVSSSYDAAKKTFTINTKQVTPPTNGQPNKVPVLIPLKVRCACASFALVLGSHLIALCDVQDAWAMGCASVGVAQMTFRQSAMVFRLMPMPMLGHPVCLRARLALMMPSCTQSAEPHHPARLLMYGFAPALRCDPCCPGWAIGS
jgi:hypothetical protein